MASETITRNDLTTILNEVLPPTPSEYRKLLWTNTQGAQTSYTVTANFSEYDEIEIVFDRVGDLITKRMGNSGSATFRIVWADYIVERVATISGTTMTFGNGSFYGSYNSGSASAGAAYAVPTMVYGIKYDRVMPPQSDVIGEIYTASWTATSGNNGTRLTEILKLPVGVYVFGISTPVASVTPIVASINGVPNRIINNNGSDCSAVVVNVTDASQEYYLVQGISNSITYTATERGGLTALRIR